MKYVVDANLLILYIVGTLRHDWIGKRSHIKNFTRQDFGRLIELIEQSDGIVLVPHAITEASNLAVKEVIDPLFSEIRAAIRAVVNGCDEAPVTSRAAAARPQYIRLGLTDTAMLEACGAEIAIATTDGALAAAAWEEGKSVEFFPTNDVRHRR